MIETEEQRRWWFATHPEYSWGSGGIHRPSGNEGWSENDKNGSKADPRDFDEYVDNALKYESDESVVALLESIKRNFGTEAELSKEQQNLKLLKRILRDGWGATADDWGTPAGTSSGGGLYISEFPRMPTMDELSRWPIEMVKQFFRYIDTVIQNNPVLMDPNALEEHHMLVRQFAEYFIKCGLRLEDFTVIMTAADHRLKGEEGRPGGLHTGKGRGGDWNREWKEFIDQWPDPDNSRYINSALRTNSKT